MNRRRVFRIAAVIVLIPVVAVGGWLLTASAMYTPEYVARVIAWGESDVGDYLTNFPQRRLTASPDPRPFAVALDEDRVEGVLASALGVDDLDAFLTQTQTQSLIVIIDDEVVFERYANGWQRDSMVTSFSVAKSFVSTLVGIAIEEGAIGSLDDPITTYLPELAERDPRFGQITIRHLLLMSSGLDYEEIGLVPVQRRRPADDLPSRPAQAGAHEHPDRRAAGHDLPLQQVPPAAARDDPRADDRDVGVPHGPSRGCGTRSAWSSTAPGRLDSEASGFEKMEAGLNARAIDFAKLGRLFLHEGTWDGTRILSPEWVATATGVDRADRAPGAPPGRYLRTHVVGRRARVRSARLLRRGRSRPICLRVAVGRGGHRPERGRVRRVIVSLGRRVHAHSRSTVTGTGSITSPAR